MIEAAGQAPIELRLALTLEWSQPSPHQDCIPPLFPQHIPVLWVPLSQLVGDDRDCQSDGKTGKILQVRRHRSLSFPSQQLLEKKGRHSLGSEVRRELEAYRETKMIAEAAWVRRDP